MYRMMLLAGISLSFGLLSLMSIGGQASADEYPSAEISNGLIKMKLFLPDPEKGYYRGTRFDWSGVMPQLEYNGHNYFGEWKETHDPGVHDDIVGPVEEFKTRGTALGYDEAKPGETFVKIGIGLLEKIDEPDYRFSHPYKIIETGKWKVKSGADWITFQHDFSDESGWGYRYTKQIRLARSRPEFTIEHKLKNKGLKHIETHQYNHNFFVIDGTPIGRDYVLRFPFEVEAKRDLKGIMETKGNELVFVKDLEEGSVFTELEGFGDGAEDHEIVIENKKTGAGVRINGDTPIAQFNFWTIKITVCPEPYIELNIAPGDKVEWETKYTLYTIGEKSN
ncbi:hypothetical protein ACFL6S_08690 [Candidatus Poribacteria bacterium]